MLFIFLFVIIISLFILNVREAEGAGCISVDMDETDFLADNSEGIISRNWEQLLTIDNDCGSTQNITITFTTPDGEDTGKTKHIYPHIFSDRHRNKDRGMSYSVQVEEGRTKLYPDIKMNWSTFADEYHFQCLVKNEDDGTSITPIDISVEVEEYNDIHITWNEKKDKEKTVSNGTAIYYVRLTNRGNIYQEKVTVKVQHEHHLNLTHVKTEYPPNQDYLNPEFFERDCEMIVEIWITSKEQSGSGTFLIDVIVETPNNDPPPEEHDFIELKFIIQAGSDDRRIIEEPSTEISMRVKIMVGGGISAIFMAVFGSYYFLALRKGKEEDEEQGWGDGGSWTDEGWGTEEEADDEDVYYGTPIADDFLTPIAHQAPPAVKEIHKVTPSKVLSPKATPNRDLTTTHITCPGCRKNLKISNPKRPLTVKCPKCEAKLKLKGKEERSRPPTPSRIRNTREPTQTTTRVKCPKCAVPVKITNPKRPLKIGCPKCTATFIIKGKQGNGKPSGPNKTPLSEGKGATGKIGSVTRISCPKCSARIKLTNPKRPLKITCPKCEAKLHLK